MSETATTAPDAAGAPGASVAVPPAQHVIATYDIETSLDLEQAAEVLAGEQSTGTFIRVARESDDLRARFAAQVESLDELPLTGASPLPGSVGDPAKRRRARLKLRFPLSNFGPSLPNLQAAVAGNLFEIKELSAIKLVELHLPQAFAERYPGPAFGVEGTRQLVSRPAGAMIGTIVKPSIGLSPEELAEVVGELAAAGIDFIKDDELQGNGPSAPLEARVKAVMPVLERHADRTGVKPMYAFNITDDLDQLERNHDLVVEAGGTCVMVCINLIGLAGVDFLRRRSMVPIHGHRAMFGAISRSEQLGFSFRAWQKLARLAGVDHLHTNGISNKFYESDADVLDSVEAVREPLLGQRPTLPVLSSGQWAGLAHATYAATGTTDLLVLAGGGIHGHPGGVAAGVAAMRDAWASAEGGESVEQALSASAAFRAAVETFGPPRA
jgi:ribulose-bisphosphate carboxylase large chain